MASAHVDGGRGPTAPQCRNRYDHGRFLLAAMVFAVGLVVLTAVVAYHVAGWPIE